MPYIAQKAASVDLTAPGPIGGTTPAAGTFTALTATGNINASNASFLAGASGVSAASAYGFNGNGAAGMGLPTNGKLVLWSGGVGATDVAIALNTTTGYSNSSTNDRVVILGNGNVLINTALQVAGGAAFAGPVSLPSYTTATRPTYGAGKVIFDTTLGKMCIGGAAAWEAVTSA